MVKNPPANARDSGLISGMGRFPGEGNGNPLQYSPWRIPWTKKPGGLQSMGSQRFRHDWATYSTYCSNIGISHCFREPWLLLERILKSKGLGEGGQEAQTSGINKSWRHSAWWLLLLIMCHIFESCWELSLEVIIRKEQIVIMYVKKPKHQDLGAWMIFGTSVSLLRGSLTM